MINIRNLNRFLNTHYKLFWPTFRMNKWQNFGLQSEISQSRGFWKSIIAMPHMTNGGCAPKAKVSIIWWPQGRPPLLIMNG